MNVGADPAHLSDYVTGAETEALSMAATLFKTAVTEGQIKARADRLAEALIPFRAGRARAYHDKPAEAWALLAAAAGAALSLTAGGHYGPARQIVGDVHTFILATPFRPRPAYAE